MRHLVLVQSITLALIVLVGLGHVHDAFAGPTKIREFSLGMGPATVKQLAGLYEQKGARVQFEPYVFAGVSKNPAVRTAVTKGEINTRKRCAPSRPVDCNQERIEFLFARPDLGHGLFSIQLSQWLKYTPADLDDVLAKLEAKYGRATQVKVNAADRDPLFPTGESREYLWSDGGSDLHRDFGPYLPKIQLMEPGTYAHAFLQLTLDGKKVSTISVHVFDVETWRENGKLWTKEHKAWLAEQKKRRDDEVRF